jgi:hypothetical protein
MVSADCGHRPLQAETLRCPSIAQVVTRRAGRTVTLALQRVNLHCLERFPAVDSPHAALRYRTAASSMTRILAGIRCALVADAESGAACGGPPCGSGRVRHPHAGARKIRPASRALASLAVRVADTVEVARIEAQLADMLAGVPGRAHDAARCRGAARSRLAALGVSPTWAR